MNDALSVWCAACAVKKSKNCVLASGILRHTHSHARTVAIVYEWTVVAYCGYGIVISNVICARAYTHTHTYGLFAPYITYKLWSCSQIAPSAINIIKRFCNCHKIAHATMAFSDTAASIFSFRHPFAPSLQFGCI